MNWRKRLALRGQLPEVARRVRCDVLLEGYVLRVLTAPDGSRHRVRVPVFSPPFAQVVRHIDWARVAAAAADSERDKAA